MSFEHDADAQRLRTLKHIVVVMMENRSFDHMLGYLTQEGMVDVDGLLGNEVNLDSDGKERRVHAFDAEAHKVQRRGEALVKALDPDHSPTGVRMQLGKGYGQTLNGGFVKSFEKSRKPPEDLRDVPMGYYTSKDVPVYDHFARQYCVCDRWYAAVPGDTWPNRLYAVAGEQGENVLKKSKLLEQFGPLKKLRNFPLFDVDAFTQQLNRKQWRWYSHDPATLRAADATYRNPTNLMPDNFAFFDRRKVSALTHLLERPISRAASFLDDVSRGEHLQVSWIDPNFVDTSVLETASNDDHPPSDIRAGQAFVFDVYDALLHSDDWEDTLLVVTYDEHGGFYDHVTPPALPADDPVAGRYRTYGVRVPALFVGPRVQRMVLHEPATLPDRDEREQPQWDHTALIKTILYAFASNPRAAVRKMPPRVHHAPHLGSILLDAPRDDVDDPRNARDLMDRWRAEARRRRLARRLDEPPIKAGEEVRSPAPDGAGHDVVLTEFQVDWQRTADALRTGLRVDA